MRFYQVDVFAEGPFHGNQLAVFLDASDLTNQQMQSIAAEMNLSETAFVTDVDESSYSVRIFTPRNELPFAGHPTLGSAWLLRHLGHLKKDEVQQHSPAGATPVRFSGDVVWFRRTGTAGEDLRSTLDDAELKVARALGLDRAMIGLEPRELGRSVAKLNPSVTDAGIPHLLVPLRDREALRSCRVVPDLISNLPPGEGAYCFTATRAGGIEARGLYPGMGIEEDPATGSAAACLGIYLAERVGPIELEIEQGIQIGRPSRLLISARSGEVDVGGRCELIFEATLSAVP